MRYQRRFLVYFSPLREYNVICGILRWEMNGMRRARKKALSKKTVFWMRVMLPACIVLGLFVLLDARLRPVITTMAQYRCRVVSILAMNEAVMEELAISPDMSEQLICVQRGADGAVTSITVNSSGLNEVKSRLTEAVANRLVELEKQVVDIPLGTLLGWQLFAGRGPNVRLQVVPASFVQATTENELVTAGINQTQHRISVHFKVEMSAILPGYSTSVTVENDVCVAETLIVGEVPKYYAVTN
ncbi:MAG: sporulation protein YunB [Ruthenibacterium sp.]